MLFGAACVVQDANTGQLCQETVKSVDAGIDRGKGPAAVGWTTHCPSHHQRQRLLGILKQHAGLGSSPPGDCPVRFRVEPRDQVYPVHRAVRPTAVELAQPARNVADSSSC